jgi:LRV protein FeS4 cluster/Leucine rich repeat variant
MVAHLHHRFIAERQLKVLSMSERHSGVSSLLDVTRADCSVCPHRALLAEGRCVPGDICLTAQSGRQIDRFLRRNPQIAQDYLNDGFWERRAIAARYAPLELMRQMPRDVDEVVRRVVASRLPIDELDDYLHDTDREVRMTVAERIAPERLTAFIGDEDYLVRLQAAKRLPHGQLRRMVGDEDREVRKEVARRLPPFALSMMAKDEDAEVRRIVAARVLPADATKMLADSDWVVRLEAAQIAPLEDIAGLADDVEPDVRAAVRQRLNDLLLGGNE